MSCWKCYKKGHIQRECQGNYIHPGNLTDDCRAERWLPSLNKAPKEGLKASALSGGKNRIYLEGSIYCIPCLMLVDTRTDVTILRGNLARILKERLIYATPNISNKTATGEKAGKLDASIECGFRKFEHRVYVADITDSCILSLYFLQKF
ncbi:hypothetical protein AVEN_9335-1 [Araneus ventricosus]|uniref:CCHC-type domain-containing protein n=1 Tax=Araneus ventricosus TaxID=182803 RepID=A0A4Y2DM65_ARAVE|nr:hypothetical protein AVEN_9335-1 [Araneus ventricosus]